MENDNGKIIYEISMILEPPHWTWRVVLITKNEKVIIDSGICDNIHDGMKLTALSEQKRKNKLDNK